MTERAPDVRAPDRELFARSVLTAFWCLFGAALAEGVLAAARSPLEKRSLVGLGAVLEAQLLALGVSFLLGAMIFWSAAARRGLRRRGLHWAEAGERLEFGAAALIVLPCVPLGVAKSLLALQLHLKNPGLIAWTTGFVALFSCLFSVLVIVWFGARLGQLRERFLSRTVLAPAVLLAPGVLVAVTIAVLVFREAGLGQLDRWLLLAPLCAASCLPLALRLGRELQGRALSWLAKVSVASLIAAVLAHASIGDAIAVLSRHGAWSRPLLSLLRGVTDFDADGYSGWFSGGDCAPFDRQVHPGASEIAHDGLDNNCVAGDGGGLSPIQAPVPARALPGVPKRPNLLLVTIETLRADHVSLLGYRRRTTPRLEELGRDSFVFEKTYATAPSTRLSLAALLSGQLPSAIHWLPQHDIKQMRRIAPDTPWLPSRLSQIGYFTLAVHTDFRAFTAVESAGFERGFRRFDVSTRLSFVGGTMQGFPGEAEVDRALSLLGAAGDEPWFLWTHLMEPHYLYEQPPNVPRFGTDEMARYDAEIAEADRQVGRLVDGLQQRGLLETTLILVLGDHGEEFGEHGQRFHGSNLYEPQLRTAGLLRIPGVTGGPISEPVSFVDLMPTLLDLMGIRSGFEKLMGRNLVPLLAGHRPEPGLFVENFRVNDGTEAMLGWVDWPLKLIYTQDGATLELYDVARDPREKNNLYFRGNPAARRLEDRLYRYLESDVRQGVAGAQPR